ncbi:MAG: WecB/TagA/CpsF family glycosyltransferase [Planctomycetota bacterium]
MSPSACEIETASDSPPICAHDRVLSILGVHITDVSKARALQMLQTMIAARDGRARAVYFVNTHTLNCAAADESYRRVLNSATCVFGDGTGVRWAARLQGVRVRDNLCGTDLTPALLSTADQPPRRYFLLGGTEALIHVAAEKARALFPHWNLAGFHHGYLGDPKLNDNAIAAINAAAPDVLLVGMGNPLQERWIDANRRRLHVPLCLGVGGLFHYWADDLKRTPRWLRRLGMEWLGILCQQPQKAARYLAGNPLYLGRVVRERCRGRA